MTFKIGLIIGSARVVRVAPQVAQFVLDSLKIVCNEEPSAIKLRRQPTIESIDLKDYQLPIFDEPAIPQFIQSSEGYTHEHTRLWSRKIASYDGFIFLASQRNWGMPAELKNAIDYLYHEWKGKPALIVSYGGGGGPQSAEQVKTVIGSMGMKVVDKMVHMAFPNPAFRNKACKGEDVGLDASNDEGPWAEHREEIANIFWREMVEKMLIKQQDQVN